LIGLVIAYLNERGWGRTIDSGWSDWDLEIHCDRWTVVRVVTAQEEHGSGKRLIRACFRLRATPLTRSALALALPLVAGALVWEAWPFAAGLGALLAAAGLLWWRGTYRAALALALVDAPARDLGLIRVEDRQREAGTHASMPIAEVADEGEIAGALNLPSDGVNGASRQFLPPEQVPRTG
jgi:hypothetical protein